MQVTSDRDYAPGEQVVYSFTENYILSLVSFVLVVSNISFYLFYFLQAWIFFRGFYQKRGGKLESSLLENLASGIKQPLLIFVFSLLFLSEIN